MTRIVNFTTLQEQSLTVQLLNFAQCGALSVHHLLCIIITGKKINTVSSQVTRGFNWDCLHKLVLRTQETAEQNPENAEQIAYDAGLTCDWRIDDNVSRPFVYWIPQNGMTSNSFD
jgi:hypothetical protein